jgi:hypothetical protein
MVNLSDNLTTNIISFTSLIVAATTTYFYFRDRKKDKFLIITEYQKGLLEWYSKTIEILILLRCANMETEREKSLAFLSSQIEIGRFFFPNITATNGFGSEKPLAYQGYRNLSLDFLVYSYNILKRQDYQNNHKELEVFQREFTSIVFNIINPKDYLKQIKKMTDKYFADEKIFEDYIKTKNESQLTALINKVY